MFLDSTDLCFNQKATRIRANTGARLEDASQQVHNQAAELKLLKSENEKLQKMLVEEQIARDILSKQVSDSRTEMAAMQVKVASKEWVGN